MARLVRVGATIIAATTYRRGEGREGREAETARRRRGGGDRARRRRDHYKHGRASHAFCSNKFRPNFFGSQLCECYRYESL